MLDRLLDVYTITGTDEGSTYCGRGYNPKLGRWVGATNTNIGASIQTRHVLRDADFVVHTAAGAIKLGVIVWAFVVNDATAPNLTTPWFVGITGKARLPVWHGRIPMGAGILWRIHRGGVIDTDIVTMGVGYERQ